MWKTILAIIVIIAIIIIANRTTGTGSKHPDNVKKPKVVQKLLKKYPATLANVTGWAKEENWKALDREHDFIQVLFPITEPGVAHQDLVLGSRDIAFLKRDEEFSRMYEEALMAMCRFYGIRLKKTRVPGGSRTIPEFEIDPNREDNFEKFFIQSGHNHKRITRMIKFLGLMDSRFYQGFKKFALQAARDNNLSQITIEFWETA